MDEKAKAEVQRVLDYAKTHPWEPAKNPKPPGDNPSFVAHLQVGYRCVFTFSRSQDGSLWRQLSVSVPGHGKWPNPFSVWAIANMFGFTGWDEKSFDPPSDWIIKRDGGAAMVLQEIISERKVQ